MERIEIKGFQSHKNSVLEFNKGFNILLGASDSGKTAIHRAIRWVVNNEPLGDGYVNNSLKKCSVTIHTEYGYVNRYKGGNENSYTVCLNGQEPKYFQGFGTKVPDEVTLLGMNKARFGDDFVWLNYASQLDAPYLLSETSGQAARILGKLAGTEDLDAAGKITNSDLIKLRATQKQAQEQSAKLIIDLQQFEGLEALEDKLSALRSLYTKVEVLSDKLLQMKKLHEDYDRANSLVDAFRAIIKRLVIPDADTFNLLKSTILKQSDLKRLYGDSLVNTKKIQEAKAYIDRVILKAKPPVECSEIQSMLAVRSDLIKLHGQYLFTQTQIKSLSRTLSAAKNLQDMEQLIPRIKLEQLAVLKGINVKYDLVLRDLAAGRKLTAVVIPDISELKGKLSRYTDYILFITAHKVHVDVIASRRKEGAIALFEKQKHIREYKDYLVGLGQCPVCQADMDAERIQQYISNM